MGSTSWDSISITAHYTAQIWARQHLPWAWHFDTLKGRLFYAAVQPLCSMAALCGLTAPPDFLVQRHRIIDALVDELAPVQLLELAGGLSPRGLAYSDKHGARAIDVDLEAVIRLKAEIVGEAAPSNYRQQVLDLIACHGYTEELKPALQAIAPTVVITEGILPYFSLRQQRHVFGQIARLLRHCGGGSYLTDIHHQDEVDRLPLHLGKLFRGGLQLITRSPQSPMIADRHHGRDLLLRAGFDGVVVHDPADWHHCLGLPVRSRGSGLRIYQATVEPTPH